MMLESSLYIDEFEAAIERTKNFNLELPPIDISDNRYLSDNMLEDVPAVLYEALGELSLNEIVAQCMSIHKRVQQPLNDFFKINFMYTIGYVYFEPDYLFKKTEDELKELMNNRPASPEINIHTWLTLPSMEILDFSLPTSMAVHYGWKQGHGHIISSHADELKHGLKYHPMLVGEDYLRKIGALVDFTVYQI